jgi:hypothetical protein
MTKAEVLAEVRKRKWPRPVMMAHSDGGRFFVCAEPGGSVFGHGNSWAEAFADADRRATCPAPEAQKEEKSE